MNVPDKRFRLVIEWMNEESIVLADYGFRSANSFPDNCKLYAKGTWNERMCVTTALSMVTVIWELK